MLTMPDNNWRGQIVHEHAIRDIREMFGSFSFDVATFAKVKIANIHFLDSVD
jgi:hypothetical protein